MFGSKGFGLCVVHIRLVAPVEFAQLVEDGRLMDLQRDHKVFGTRFDAVEGRVKLCLVVDVETSSNLALTTVGFDQRCSVGQCRLNATEHVLHRTVLKRCLSLAYAVESGPQICETNSKDNLQA